MAIAICRSFLNAAWIMASWEWIIARSRESLESRFLIYQDIRKIKTSQKHSEWKITILRLLSVLLKAFNSLCQYFLVLTFIIFQRKLSLVLTINLLSNNLTFPKINIKTVTSPISAPARSFQFKKLSTVIIKLHKHFSMKIEFNFAGKRLAGFV